MRFAPILSGVLAVLLGACGNGPGEGDSGSPAGPNVVLLVMDTTRADRCSLYGYEKPTTPILSALAAEGACFRNVWSPSPWTGPSHASLFTGLRPEHHRFLWGRLRPYLGNTPTLAGWFRDKGYATACFSNNAFVSEEYGLEQGFDHASRDFEDINRPYPTAPATHRAALEWVQQRVSEGRSFLLFVNDMEPHSPYFPPADFETKFMPPTIALDLRSHARTIGPDDLLNHLGRKAPLAPSTIKVLSHLYDAEVAFLDREVGVLLNGIRQMGILDDTVFVVVADHGENLGEHGLVDHQGSLHRTVLHVPLVVRYPPRFPAGTVREELVRLEDLTPTILDLCGLQIPEGLDGENLLGPLGGRIARSTFLPIGRSWEQMQKLTTSTFDLRVLGREIRAVNDGRWHYIAYSDGTMELYDLLADPREKMDIARAHPDEVRRLSALLPVLPGSVSDPEALPPR
ncbi:MAG: sulfatase-like hydrolase/transferase [Planctomycetes bacterium]|jgi:arylsulfatase A-like enzyme|nr:sulfatase-like hydrolase/transferase [Planctomycetota bacterium]